MVVAQNQRDIWLPLVTFRLPLGTCDNCQQWRACHGNRTLVSQPLPWHRPVALSCQGPLALIGHQQTLQLSWEALWYQLQLHCTLWHGDLHIPISAHQMQKHKCSIFINLHLYTCEDSIQKSSQKDYWANYRNHQAKIGVTINKQFSSSLNLYLQLFWVQQRDLQGVLTYLYQ